MSAAAVTLLDHLGVFNIREEKARKTEAAITFTYFREWDTSTDDL